MKRIHWGYKGERFVSDVSEEPCKRCGMRAVVELPAMLLAEQPDATTHVCHPGAGGCNRGFTMYPDWVCEAFARRAAARRKETIHDYAARLMKARRGLSLVTW